MKVDKTLYTQNTQGRGRGRGGRGNNHGGRGHGREGYYGEKEHSNKNWCGRGGWSQSHSKVVNMATIQRSVTQTNVTAVVSLKLC